MYLISAYFDEQTGRELNRLIQRIAIETGNSFMTRNQVPPHLTISAFETREPEDLIPSFLNFSKTVKSSRIMIASPGILLPYVMYAAPVINRYLQELMEKTYAWVSEESGVSVNRFYRPYQWMPHVTLGKTLDQEQMKAAFSVIQQYFVPMQAEIMELGLARTNPHRDLERVILQHTTIEI